MLSPVGVELSGAFSLHDTPSLYLDTPKMPPSPTGRNRPPATASAPANVASMLHTVPPTPSPSRHVSNGPKSEHGPYGPPHAVPVRLDPSRPPISVSVGDGG